ncbi:MAG TPA: hypothetical protein VGH74_07520 [Planctomycetaceae bacterium]|jgi:hypothetical protein
MSALVEKQLLGSSADILTSELNSLAASAWTALGAAYNNTIAGGGGDGYVQALVRLVCTLAANATAGSGFNLILAKSLDAGSTYEDTSTASVALNRTFDVFLPYTTGQATTNVSIPIWLPPGLWKPYGQNTDASHAMTSSGNKVSILPFTREIV